MALPQKSSPSIRKRISNFVHDYLNSPPRRFLSYLQSPARMFPIRKLVSYVGQRQFAVVLLWIAGGGLLKLFNVIVDAATDQPHAPLKLLSLGVFVDYRLIVMLVAGVLVIAGLVTLMLTNLTLDKDDREYIINFLSRLWDEVSSAATHAGAALTAAEIYFPGSVWGPTISTAVSWGVIAIYFLAGYLAYRLDEKTGSAPGVGGTPSPSVTPPPVVVPLPAPTVTAAPAVSPPPVTAAPAVSPPPVPPTSIP